MNLSYGRGVVRLGGWIREDIKDLSGQGVRSTICENVEIPKKYKRRSNRLSKSDAGIWE